MSYAKCIVCGKEFKDTHPSRKGNKFCCRKHFNEYKKKNGTWNKGKKWEEMYDPETLNKLKKHVKSTGKKHFNYGTNRVDAKIRNLLNNPRYSENKINEINREIEKKGIEKVLIDLGENAQVNRKIYQRICFDNWGDKCLNCGASKKDVQIDVHHIDKNRKNNFVSNLIPLCNKCHRKFENDEIKCRELQASFKHNN